MSIQTEEQYQAAMKRLEHLIDYDPENLDEITSLGNEVDQYEIEQGHAPEKPE